MKNKNIEDAKRYLQRALRLDLKIEQKRERQRELRAKAASIPSGLRSGGGGGGGAHRARYEDLIHKAEDLESEIQAQIIEAELERNRIAADIDCIENKLYADVLYKRYIQGKTLERIALDKCYSYDWIRHVHGLAMLAFSEHFKSTHKNT